MIRPERTYRRVQDGTAETIRAAARADQVPAAPAPGTGHLRLLRRAIGRIERLTRELVQPLDLTPPQAIALLILRERDGPTQAALVAAMDSDANTVSGLVRRLEQRGLLTRERRERDARAVKLSLTPDGIALAGRAQAAFARLAAALDDTVPRRSGTTIAAWLRAISAIHDL